MGLEVFKICPNCGKKNAANAIECVYCAEELFGVSVVGEGEPINSVNEPEISANPMVRICEECGFSNPANERKCRSCGEDISDIIPTPESREEGFGKCMLVSLDGEEAYQITDELTLLGRTEMMKEYLQSKSYVSRKHAMISWRNGKLYVQNLSKTNYTFVNNVRIPDDEETELHDGDELALGGNENNGSRQDQAAYFQVRIGSCL